MEREDRKSSATKANQVATAADSHAPVASSSPHALCDEETSSTESQTLQQSSQDHESPDESAQKRQKQSKKRSLHEQSEEGDAAEGEEPPIISRPRKKKAIARASTKNTPTSAGQAMLSPMKDERKVTPRKSRLPKHRQSLEARFSAVEAYDEAEVQKIITELYKEQEKDDRDMYCLSTDLVREETQCERSGVVEELSMMEFRRMLTYGEVSVASVSSTILPFLKLEKDDIFYDLGCGTGKIVIQAALQTPCAVAKGIELMQNRVREGAKALERLSAKDLDVMKDKHVVIVQGDICKPPEAANMMDATVVFINNVCFGPALMLQVMNMLSQMPNLRRVVTLRKVCERHRQEKCTRQGSLCVEYVHPPQNAEIHVSWASKTSVYLYERVDFSLMQLADQLQVPISS